MKLDEYDHLNANDPLKLTVDMDELARKIVSMNYGTVRFLAALVRARRGSKNFIGQSDVVADSIESLIQKGEF